jgi:hypothetical protein
MFIPSHRRHRKPTHLASVLDGFILGTLQMPNRNRLKYLECFHNLGLVFKLLKSVTDVS